MRFFSLLLLLAAPGCTPTDPLDPYCAPDTPCALTGDGQPTQDISRACVPGKLVCKNGYPHACVGYQGKCPQSQPPALETCNGLDDDGDGSVDNGIETSFYYPEDEYPGTLGRGVCAPGFSACQDGQPISVNPRLPGVEICANQQDDDCDGSVDEATGPSVLAVHFVVDFSGSMSMYLDQVIVQSCMVAENLETEFPGSTFALTAYGTETGGSPDFAVTLRGFGDAFGVCQSFQTGDRGQDAEEYPLDACLEADNLPWPPDAIRYMVLFSDEPLKSYRRMTDVYTDIRSACLTDGYTIVVYATGETLGDFTTVANDCGGTYPMLLDLFYSDTLEQVVRPDCSE